MTHVPTNTFTDLEFALLNRFQRDFPLVSRPFAALAQQLDISENCVIGHLQQLQDRGAISRVGAAFRPNAIGASALAALAVPQDRLEEVAACVSAMPPAKSYAKGSSQSATPRSQKRSVQPMNTAAKKPLPSMVGSTKSPNWP